MSLKGKKVLTIMMALHKKEVLVEFRWPDQIGKNCDLKNIDLEKLLKLVFSFFLVIIPLPHRNCWHLSGLTIYLNIGLRRDEPESGLRKLKRIGNEI